MSFPKLLTKQIDDQYTQETFKRVEDFFVGDAVTRCGFEFIEVVFATAVTSAQVLHKLGYTPKDVILMHNLNNATVTFTYTSFSSTAIVVTTSAATTLRMLVGRYS